MQLLHHAGLLIGGVVLAAHPVRLEIQRLDILHRVPLIQQVLDHFYQALVRKIHLQHTDMIAYLAQHPAAVFIVHIFHREHRQLWKIILFQTVLQTKDLPNGGGQSHGLHGTVDQHAHLQLRHQLLCLPQQVMVERDHHQPIGDIRRTDLFDHPGHKVRVVIDGGLQFQLDKGAFHFPAQRQCLLQGSDPLILVAHILPAAKVQRLQLLHGHVVDLAPHIGVPVNEKIVVDDQLFVSGLLYVHLHAVRADLHRLAECCKGIFRCKVGRTTVCNDLRHHSFLIPLSFVFVFYARSEPFEAMTFLYQ